MQAERQTFPVPKSPPKPKPISEEEFRRPDLHPFSTNIMKKFDSILTFRESNLAPAEKDWTKLAIVDRTHKAMMINAGDEVKLQGSSVRMMKDIANNVDKLPLSRKSAMFS